MMTMQFDDLFDDPLAGLRPEKRKKVGGYVLSKSLGEGSFAKVRLGTHILTKEKVAVKVISKKLIRKKDYVKKNLRREALMLQRLRHPNIVRLYEVMETENAYYLVTELAQGGDLMKYLNKRHCFTETEARRYLRQIVSAVDHMHRSGVIHRDLKIENLLLDEDMNIKIIDFGLSNVWDGRSLLSTQCGSPAYAAPEIFSKKEYGTTVDVWSIGVDLYAMLVGRLPFLVEPPTNLSKLHALILKGCSVPDHLSSGCKDLIQRLLEPSETKRITMSQLLAHPWLNEGYVAMTPWPPRAKPTTADLDPDVLRCIVINLHVTETDIIDALVRCKPNHLYGAYHLLSGRLQKRLGFPDTVASRGLGRELITEMRNHKEELGSGTQPGRRTPMGSGNKDGGGSSSTSGSHVTSAASSAHVGKRDVVPPAILPSLERASTRRDSASSSKEGSRIIVLDNTADIPRDASAASDVKLPGVSQNKENESLASLDRSSASRGDNSASGSRCETPRTTYRTCLKELQKQKQSQRGILKVERAPTFVDPLDCVAEANSTPTSTTGGRVYFEDPKNVRFQINSNNLDRAQLTPCEVQRLSDQFMVSRKDTEKSRQAMLAGNEEYGQERIGQLLHSNDSSNQMHALDVMHTSVQQKRQPPPAPPNSALGGRRQHHHPSTTTTDNDVIVPREIIHIPNPDDPREPDAESTAVTLHRQNIGMPPPAPPQPQYRLRDSEKLGSQDENFYDKYRFKVRSAAAAGDRLVVMDVKNVYPIPPAPPGMAMVRRSKTMPVIRTRKLGLLDDNQKEKQQVIREVQVANLGAFYTMPQHRRSSGNLNRTKSERQATINASLPVTWGTRMDPKRNSSSSYHRGTHASGDLYRQYAQVRQPMPVPAAVAESNPNK